MARKKLDSGFIASVPEMVREVRSFLEQTVKNPAIPFPWPPYVPKPERLAERIDHLEEIYREINDESIRTGGKLGRQRKRVKTAFVLLARHVVLSLEGGIDVARWPGFDLGRHPGEGRCGRRYRCRHYSAFDSN